MSNAVYIALALGLYVGLFALGFCFGWMRGVVWSNKRLLNVLDVGPIDDDDHICIGDSKHE